MWMVEVLVLVSDGMGRRSWIIVDGGGLWLWMVTCCIFVLAIARLGSVALLVLCERVSN